MARNDPTWANALRSSVIKENQEYKNGIAQDRQRLGAHFIQPSAPIPVVTTSKQKITSLENKNAVSKKDIIPKFYFPFGKRADEEQWDDIEHRLKHFFYSLPNKRATLYNFAEIAKLCRCPIYLKKPLFIACGGNKKYYIDMTTFLQFWKQVCATCHDLPSKFVRILTRSETAQTLKPNHFKILIEDVINTHPKLTQLKNTPSFHSRYVMTVTTRIYYDVNSSWNGIITLTEIRRSKLMESIVTLEDVESINDKSTYFNYVDFFVTYFKFWQLDLDHDLYISIDELRKYEFYALSSRVIKRIFSGPVMKRNNNYYHEANEYYMNYIDFIWFIMAEEDKNHPRSIEYWFKCMDLDGDGYLSMFELKYFYKEQLARMKIVNFKWIPSSFSEFLCPLLDMVKPKCQNKISLADLKACRVASLFFNTFLNVQKYYIREENNPYRLLGKTENDKTDWEIFTATKYKMIIPYLKEIEYRQKLIEHNFWN